MLYFVLYKEEPVMVIKTSSLVGGLPNYLKDLGYHLKYSIEMRYSENCGDNISYIEEGGSYSIVPTGEYDDVFLSIPLEIVEIEHVHEHVDRLQTQAAVMVTRRRRGRKTKLSIAITVISAALAIYAGITISAFLAFIIGLASVAVGHELLQWYLNSRFPIPTKKETSPPRYFARLHDGHFIKLVDISHAMDLPNLKIYHQQLPKFKVAAYHNGEFLCDWHDKIHPIPLEAARINDPRFYGEHEEFQVRQWLYHMLVSPVGD
jgi:hypothetical protein